MQNTKYILTICLVALISIFTTAQSVNVRVANQVIQGQRFTVTISVTNGEANITRDNAPVLSGCTLIAGPGISTMQSVQFVNGKQSSSVTKDYTFTYTADKAGTVTIPSLKVKVSGKDMTTQAKSLTILPPDQSSRRNTPAYGYGYPSSIDEMEELMNELMGGTPGFGRQPAQPQPSRPQQTTQISPKDFIIAVNMSKNNIYEKEAVIATIKLYTKHDVSKFQPKVMPQFEGFLSEEIDVSNQVPQQESYHGENYYTLILKKCLLYPQKSGNLTINSGTYDVTLETYDLVSNGYFVTQVPKSHNITTTSNSITVSVKPLPSPAPSSFNGAVGDFEVSSSLNPEQLRTNEAAKYVLTVKGTGNITHLAEPTIPFPATVEEYTPVGESDAKFNGSNMQGTYTATYTIVPQEVGTLEIPEWEYSYFNPSTGKYVTVKLPSYTRTVGKGIASSQSAPGSNQNLDEGAIRDIRHITKVDFSSLSKEPEFIFSSPWYWLAYIFLALVLIFTSFFYRKRIRSLNDIQGRRIRKAKSVATKRLSKARQAMNNHNSDEFYAALSSALWGFLSDKLKIAASALTRDNIADTLEKAGAEEDTVKRTINVLDECEMARFTPEHSDTEMSRLYEEASGVIDSLNKLKQNQKTTAVQSRQSRYGI